MGNSTGQRPVWHVRKHKSPERAQAGSFHIYRFQHGVICILFECFTCNIAAALAGLFLIPPILFTGRCPVLMPAPFQGLPAINAPLLVNVINIGF